MSRKQQPERRNVPEQNDSAAPAPGQDGGKAPKEEELSERELDGVAGGAIPCFAPHRPEDETN